MKFIKVLNESLYSSVLRCCALCQRAALNDVCVCVCVWWNYVSLRIAAIGKLQALFFAVDSELMRSLLQLYERTIGLEIRSGGT
jgi:hypothetical protein